MGENWRNVSKPHGIYGNRAGIAHVWMFSQLKVCQSHKSISNPKKRSTNFLEYLGLKPLLGLNSTKKTLQILPDTLWQLLQWKSSLQVGERYFCVFLSIKGKPKVKRMCLYVTVSKCTALKHLYAEH